MRSHIITATVVALLAAAGAAQQQTPAASGDWPMYRHDLAGTAFSPLTQITPANVSRLAPAWSYSLMPAAADGSRPATPNSQATPIVINGTLYVPAADRVVALDAATGRELWTAPIAGGAPSRRGVAYWPGDGSVSARILRDVGCAAARARCTHGDTGNRLWPERLD
ncbi:MAG: hypothetical protein QM736_29405 [Vicinamibacterales bacterium]